MDETIKSIIRTSDLKHVKLSNILKYIFVDICHIDQQKYFILGSYAIRDHRKINDLDINLDDKEFIKLEEATKRGLGYIEFYNGQIRWFYDLTDEYNKLTNSDETDVSIEAFQKYPNVGFPNSNFSLAYLVENNGLDKDFNGHQFFSLNTLLDWKKTMNREKDKPDIDLIISLKEDGVNNLKYKNLKKKLGGKNIKLSKKSSKKILKTMNSGSTKTKKISKKTFKKTSKKTSKKTKKN